MGMFSGITKVFKKAAPLVGTALGYFYGGPAGAAFGSQVGNMFGGSSGGSGGAAEGSADEGGTDWMGMLGSLGSSAMDFFGQDKARRDAYNLSFDAIGQQNASAAFLANQSNIFSAQQAKNQMDFQREMSNTAHQREVTDLRAAGLNPILSGTGGMGNSTPSGAMGSPTTAPVQSTAPAVATAFEAMKTMAETTKINATKDFIKGVQTDQTKASTAYTKQQEHTSAAEETYKGTMSNLGAIQFDLTQANKNVAIQNLENLKAIKANLERTGKLTEAQTHQVKQNTANLGAIFKDLNMKGNISNSEYGRIMEMIKRAPSVDIGKILNAIKAKK